MRRAVGLTKFTRGYSTCVRPSVYKRSFAQPEGFNAINWQSTSFTPVGSVLYSSPVAEMLTEGTLLDDQMEQKEYLMYTKKRKRVAVKKARKKGKKRIMQ
eukprot:TRINITY_DN9480_c0_g1_i1.p1 TRINITY_DN9480_c0_g1~~TRINITY_DN9480_c0_g1_i1.p1  ORF type:complete len:107 (-),score=21.95 TRINITY_DN9480_c0_g1_i1:43-342(-)